MTKNKEHVRLSEERETLLVPLYSRAVESEKAKPIILDEKAREILTRVEYDFDALNIPASSAVMLCLRGKKLDDWTRAFLKKHPEALVLQLGCGLDSRYARLNNPEVEWYDLDLPDVIELRREFFAESERYHMIPSSVTDWNWIDGISFTGKQVFVIAEGLFMYLAEEDVQELILKLRDAAGSYDLAFDAYSKLTAKRVNKHPSIKKTGASVKWGINDARLMEEWAKGIRLRNEWYFTDADEIGKLGFGTRLAFRIAGFFSTAKKAHRLLYFTIEGK
ncbi:MAG: class I SAM-dependent methyltransferase [Candidatus Marinimicrobia bacterium]|nr:class I SAM-dependent methyltransferase [Candidatus Neomarinimicrobiota bacterium]MCF7828714.1 class I SAM-dependent methyltransferase [Candidatus Neomarinimicrobiota bacterium]MCF7880455.1 class I SAM-dependent methyltransferase [Candidatus Neomarinimicrobiota bacterium]